MLQGVAPYRLAYSMKLPGTDAAYALTMALFGQTASGIHLGLLLVNALTVWMMFVLGRRMFGPLAGVAAALKVCLRFQPASEAVWALPPTPRTMSFWPLWARSSCA